MAPRTLPVWPAPKPLEGVKSKKRAVFKAEGAEVAAGQNVVIKAVGLSVALESRIAFAGAPEHQAAVTALLRDECKPAAGAATRHRGLAVVVLGPHLAGPGADVEDHFEAVTAALREKPQIVVLQEALAGGPGWAKAFHGLLRCEDLRSFGGAVIICALEETFAIRRVCTERWTSVGDTVKQEDMGGGRGLQILEDVFGKSANSDEAQGKAKGKRGKKRDDDGGDMRDLLEAARSLSEFMFEEDLSDFARKEGWIVTLLVDVSSSGGRVLCGYMCHRMMPAPRSELHIERLAVTQKVQGRGYGKQLMRWVMEEASRIPQEECAVLSCSAFHRVVPFYGKYGFEVADCPDPKKVDDEEEDDPQTWMQRPNKSLVTG